MSRRLGYARVSTEEQDTAAQLDALRAAGCDPIFEEHGSGASRARPELARLMAEIRRGEVLVVVRLDRLARSVSHLLEVIERLEGVGAHFRSLSDPIDTSTPQGMFSLQVLGAVAQLERALISERTKAGVAAARARGKLPGNPGLRAREPAAIAKISKARDRAYMAELLAGIETWLPTVKRVVAEGLAPAALLAKAPRPKPEDRLMTLVGGIARANPDLTLRAIAAQLEGMRERTPRGGWRWSPSSVASLLERAKRAGVA